MVAMRPDASSSAALLCDSSAMPKPASTRRFCAVRLSTGVHATSPNPWAWNSAKTCDAVISRRPGAHGKCDPAFAAQLGQLPDAAAGARMIRRADDLQRLGEQHFAVEIARSVAVVAQADRRFAAPDQAADLGAGRGTQGQIDAGMLGGKALHDRRQPAARQRADHRERDRPRIRPRQRAHRVLRILGGRHRTLRIGHHHPPGVAEQGAAGDAVEQGHAEFLLQQRDAPRDRRLRAMQRLGGIRNRRRGDAPSGRC